LRRKRLIYFALAPVVALVLFQFLTCWLGRADFALLQKRSEPRFAHLAAPPSDGGSIHYEGFGYTLWNLHRLTNFGMGRHGLIIGSKIEFGLPVGLTRDRADTIILDQPDSLDTAPAGPAKGSQPIR
jgi:hypothetical protein